MESIIENHKKGEVICKEGDMQSWMYAIEQGSIGIYVRYGTPEEKQLTVLKAGQYFGEMGMLEDMERSATAVAMEDDTRTATITSEDFGEYYFYQPEKILEIMQNMSSRIRELTEDYTEACHTADEMMGSTGKVKSNWLKEQLNKLRSMLRENGFFTGEYTRNRWTKL